MTRWFFALSLTVLCLSTAAQSLIEIAGEVTDKKSKAPLPYATISLKNNSIGTITNESGEFNLFIPQSSMTDTLLVSYLGYATLQKSISAISSFALFELDESAVVLNEITVTSDAAKKMVQRALQVIPDVYPSAPYLMEGFHRSWEKVEFDDGSSCPGTLIEAAITVFDQGHITTKTSRKFNEEIYINEIRKSALMEGWNYGSGSAFRDLLDKNPVKNPSANTFIFLHGFLNFPNDLVYEWEGETTMDGEALSIVKIEIPNTRRFPAYYKVYISERDFAILRIELHGEKPNIDYDIGPWHTEYLYQVYIFRRFQGIPYLTYIKKQYTIKNLDTVNRKVLRTESYFRELMINNLIKDDIDSRLKNLAALKSKEVSLALQKNEYNEEFWRNYNIVKENPLDKEIVAYFEKSTPCIEPEKKKKQ